MTQNSSSPKNYNFMALRGASIPDQEYVETYGIPEEYANTPKMIEWHVKDMVCLLYTSPSPRDRQKSRMPSSA